MLKLIILAIFSLSTYARAPGTYSQLRSEIHKTSAKNITQLLNDFVKATSPSRLIGKEGHEKARIFLKDQFMKLDKKKTGKMIEVNFEPDVSEAHRFYKNDFNEKIEGKISKLNPDYHKWLKFTKYMQEMSQKFKHVKGQNIIWEKSGLNPNKVLVITAHYDTISQDQTSLLINENDPMPGANYNASGVTVALGLVKLLAESDLNYSVQVVFLDWQGIGFLGSYQYAKELKNSGKEIIGVLNLEMLGQDTSFFDKTKKTGNFCVYTRAHSEEERWVKNLIHHGSQMTSKVQFEWRGNGFENSDSFRFQEQGILSATFSQNWEDDFNPKFYQTPEDTPETLNHETLYASYQFLGGAVLGTLLDLTK